ncbi:MAG TPA: acetoacetate decarboxylase family protein [Gammaproteobacteria bacterium]|nr:acetoacetate decarboxylase family protein [Gammaproteobacteria bacterium]
MEIKGIPFDSPLYQVDPDRGIEYIGCEGLMAMFSIAGDVSPLLPEGLEPASSPAVGGVWYADYPFSTVGIYREFLTIIQVRDEHGETGSYVPYIYVTNDAGMAAGREILGAPKKLAGINLRSELGIVQGELERPATKRLATMTLKPSTRLDPSFMGEFLDGPSPMYSVRHLPPVGGEGGVTQLVKWYGEVLLHRDAGGDPAAFTGPCSLTYDSPSVIDPVHRVAVDEMIAGVYMRFDMHLKLGRVLRTL